VTGATNAPTVSVVVVNWNSGPYLGRLLDSLSEHPPKLPFETVVVDNGSTDGSQLAAVGRSAVTVIRNATNRGLAAANNQGIAASHGAYVLICNPDAEVTSGAVDELVAVMERHDRAAFVVPRLRRPDGSAQVSAGDLPTVTEALLGRTLGLRLTSGRPGAADAARRGWWWPVSAHDREQEIGRGAEACYLVRRGAIDEIGGQDERFPLDWEGVEWTTRARDAGWQVWLAPEAEIVHTGGVSIDRARLRWVWQSHQGMYRYFAPRLAPTARYPLATAIGLRALLKSAAVVMRFPVYRWSR